MLIMHIFPRCHMNIVVAMVLDIVRTLHKQMDPNIIKKLFKLA